MAGSGGGYLSVEAALVVVDHVGWAGGGFADAHDTAEDASTDGCEDNEDYDDEHHN